MRGIILAAGMGTRLRPITLNTPKSLIKIKNKPLIERQIEFLREKGIDEIIIVTGYLRDKFNYLVDKYNVKLIYNNKYNEYNNIYTMYLAKDYLADSYVIDADNFINRNFIIEKPEYSMYFSAFKKEVENEWKIIFDENNKVNDIQVIKGVDSAYILSGVSYWSKKDANIIISELENKIRNDDFRNLYWDDIVRENIKKLDIYIYKILENDIFEIDNLNDLDYLTKTLNK